MWDASILRIGLKFLFNYKNKTRLKTERNWKILYEVSGAVVAKKGREGHGAASTG